MLNNNFNTNMNTTPNKKNPKDAKDFVSLGSLCSSGIRSDAAM